jgi:hypothetical protein
MDTSRCSALQELVMIAFGLGREEATNTHRYCTCDELGNTTENDEL